MCARSGLWAGPSTVLALALGLAFSGPASAPAQASSFVLRSTIDALVSVGDTDNRGDHKRTSGVYRDYDWAFGYSAAIDTPQKDRQGRQFDTGRASILIGREFKDWSIYAEIGATNGAVLESAQSLVSAFHQMTVGTGTRTSAASSGLKPVVSAVLRRDFEWSADGCDGWCYGATVTPFARIGNAEVSMGAAAFAVVQLGGGAIARQDIPGLPSLPVTATFMRLGLVAKAYAYRAETAAVGTRQGQVSALAGIGFNQDGWGGSADIEVPLLAEVRDVKALPVPLITARLSRQF